MLLALVLGSLGVWYRVTGTVSADAVNSRRSEIFYWVTIMFSQTLGTALGDWAADDAELGYLGGVAVFGGALIVAACLHFSPRSTWIKTTWVSAGGELRAGIPGHGIGHGSGHGIRTWFTNQLPMPHQRSELLAAEQIVDLAMESVDLLLQLKDRSFKLGDPVFPSRVVTDLAEGD